MLRSVPERILDAQGSLPDDLLRSDTPVCLRGLVADWPLVQAAKTGSEAAVAYLGRFYQDATVGAFLGDPSAGGRVFYNETLDGFNFQPVKLKLDEFLARLLSLEHEASPPMLYLGSTTIDTCLPGLRNENDLDLGGREPLASIWIGNRTRVAAHFDVPDNLACVVLGRRRFTLFPPDQVANLYVGPWDFTPAGQPISLVDGAAPDFERFPRYRNALAAACTVELEPGDVLFIPSMWWHQVEALEPVSALVNYWWREVPTWAGTPVATLEHALLSLRQLPPAQRAAWRALFDHYVFQDDADLDHLPGDRRGSLGELDAAAARKLRAGILNKLNR
jgi:hypothetical protein